MLYCIGYCHIFSPAVGLCTVSKFLTISLPFIWLFKSRNYYIHISKKWIWHIWKHWSLCHLVWFSRNIPKDFDNNFWYRKCTTQQNIQQGLVVFTPCNAELLHILYLSCQFTGVGVFGNSLLGTVEKKFHFDKSEKYIVYSSTESSGTPKIAAAGIEVCTGMKWRAARELQVAEAQFSQMALVGMVAAGLGYIPSHQISKAKGREQRHLLKGEVCSDIQELRVSRMVGLGQHGPWTKVGKSLGQTSDGLTSTASDFWSRQFMAF